MTKQHTIENAEALLYLTHKGDDYYLRRYSKIQKAFTNFGHAFFLIDDSSSQESSPQHRQPANRYAFTTQSLKRLGYNWIGETMVPGHCHFPLLDFFRAHPYFSFYTVVEYDVYFTGTWSVLFRALCERKDDFVATHIASRKEQPTWEWWNSFKALPSTNFENEDLVRFFGPLYRISNRALRDLDSALQQGLTGHQEVVIPSHLRRRGFVVSDLNAHQNSKSLWQWDWYKKASTDRRGALSKSTMRYRPARLMPGIRPFTLYHPIKTPPIKTFLEMARSLVGLSRKTLP